MADQRTMAQLLQSPTEGYEDEIVVPAITADNFELKHGLHTFVQNKQFFEYDKEDPYAHVRYFNKITCTLKFPNVLNTEAWDRFKDLLRACPHHGFSELHQLETFYNALNSKDQDSLNSAAGGNFLDKMPRECLAIIESKSKVRYSHNKPVVAKVITNTSTSGISPDVAELKDMVTALLVDKKSQNQARATLKQSRKVVYRPPMMSNQIRPPGFPPILNNQNVQLNQRNNQNRFNQNQNRGNNFNQRPVYQPPIFQPPAYQAPVYQAPAPQTQGVLKEDFSAYVKANDAVMRNMQTQGQNMQNQLTNLTELITKFVNSNSSSTSSSGTLPSNTIANIRSELKAITTLSEATKDTMHPTNNGSTEDVQPLMVQSKSLILTSELFNSLTIEPVISTADFVVMDFDDDPRVHLILMRSFLKTRSALIDVFKVVINEFVVVCCDEANVDLDSCQSQPSILMCYRFDSDSLSQPESTRNFLLEEVDAFLAIEYDPTLLKVDQSYFDSEGDILLLEGFLNNDPSPPPQGNYMPQAHKELKIYEAKSNKSSIDEPPEVELKDLPPYLEYVFLEGDDKLPVIIAKDLSM
nr:hypothetical protein [Tanacetum cinerariifolium]